MPISSTFAGRLPAQDDFMEEMSKEWQTRKVKHTPMFFVCQVSQTKDEVQRGILSLQQQSQKKIKKNIPRGFFSTFESMEEG